MLQVFRCYLDTLYTLELFRQCRQSFLTTASNDDFLTQGMKATGKGFSQATGCSNYEDLVYFGGHIGLFWRSLLYCGKAKTFDRT